jgi:3-deoxy-manno-octulosonate cytidylyltransferase (CMP-KDO synthetase)
MAMRIVGVIPARYASTRFPGKPLALIAGRPMLAWVVEQCRKSAVLADVIVATDDARIADAMRPYVRVEMTGDQHPSGTDRVAEVAGRAPADGYVNIQGDEPLIDPKTIDAVAGLLAKYPMTTASAPLRDLAELDNPNVVKVVTDKDGRALYFSRRTVPYLRDLADALAATRLLAFPFRKHLGIYGYRRDTLLQIVQWPVSPLEAAERLEQLRALENGIPIAVAAVEHDSAGVDTPGDLEKVEARMRGRTASAK